ncbi:hypothetical protein CR513_11359, partial [Mucuna pruriens]
MTLLATFACPFAFGCSTEVKDCLMCNSWQNLAVVEDANWVPLSETISAGRPNRHIIFFHMNRFTLLELGLHLLGEVIHYHHQELKLARCEGKWPQDVYSPFVKRPWGYHRMHLFRWGLVIVGEPLASITPLHVIHAVCFEGRPIIARPGYLSCQRSPSYMPSWTSLITYSASSGPTHLSRGEEKPRLYSRCPTKAYLGASFRILPASAGSTGSFPPLNIPLLVPSTSFSARYTGLLANLMPAKSASYSAWLLLALKSKCWLCSTNTLFGHSKITPAPLPAWLDDPSTDKYHSPPVHSCSMVSSVIKSASAWAFMGPLFSKVMSNSDNCTLQATILPARFGFLNTCWMGKSVRTMMLKLWK